jgi:hypothetical protein
MATSRVIRALLLAALLPAASTFAKVTVTSSSALVFGKFAATTAGTITVSPTGARSRTGGVMLLTSTASAAAFSVSDNLTHDTSCSIALPADNSVSLSSGANQMQLKAFTSNPSGVGPLSGGALQVTVGATMTVNANQPKGNYSGSIQITVQCQ